MNFCPQSVSQSAMLSVSQSVSYAVSQSVSQLVNQSVNQSVSQSISHSISQSVIQPVQLEEKPSLTIKIFILHGGHIEIFSTGLTHDFGQNWKFRLNLFLNKMGPEKMFADHDHQVRKQAFLDYKNNHFKQWPY